jgi:protein gp37
MSAGRSLRKRQSLEKYLKTVKDICLKQDVPFFFKQWGGTQKKRAGRLFEDREWNEMPIEKKLADEFAG